MITGQVYGNFIGGEWVQASSGKTYKTVNPARKSQVIGEFQSSDRGDVQRAIERAYAAWREWRSTPPPKRGEILLEAYYLMKKRAEDFSRLIALEMGKPIGDARGEVKRALNVLEFIAGEGRRMLGETIPSEIPNNVIMTFRKPLGVVSIITPWNFPIAIPVWKIAPALVAGNAVVFKPAATTPLCGVRLMELFTEAGIPAGVLNMVTGSGSLIGDELVSNEKIAAVSFTGSTAVGRQIYAKAAHYLKKAQCEMGGKNAVVVLEDANIDAAVSAIIQGAFSSTGERCTATSRVIVEKPAREELMEKLIQRVSRLKVGDPLDEDTYVGPLAHEEQYIKVRDYIEIGKSEGAKLVYGGRTLTEPPYDDGYYVQPAVFADAKPEMRIAREEIFGPVLTVLEARDMHEAAEINNSVYYGFKTSIYTENIRKAFRFADMCDTGMVHINAPTLGGEVQAPFGGLKESGAGYKELGREAIKFYTNEIITYLDYSEQRPEVKFI